jgi:hypothetical protein
MLLVLLPAIRQVSFALLLLYSCFTPALLHMHTKVCVYIYMCVCSCVCVSAYYFICVSYYFYGSRVTARHAAGAFLALSSFYKHYT